MTIEFGVGVIIETVKEFWQPSDARRGGEWILSMSLKRNCGPANDLILDFLPPDCVRKKISLILSH